MIDFSFELKMLIKDELIQTLLLFEEDLNKEEIHAFQLVNQCYQNIYQQKPTTQLTPPLAS